VVVLGLAAEGATCVGGLSGGVGVPGVGEPGADVLGASAPGDDVLGADVPGIDGPGVEVLGEDEFGGASDGCSAVLDEVTGSM